MPNSEANFWRVHCHIGHHPGQWQYWYREQCCALGWAPPDPRRADGGWTFEGPSRDKAWSVARSALNRMRVGDWIVATLPGHRAGRLGTITNLAVRDEDWNPIVPPGSKHPSGENGRRILVRWELSTGPADISQVVLLPPAARLNSGELRATVQQLPFYKLSPIRAAMRDDTNWVSLGSQFRHETALSDYLSIYPHYLESGLIAHPSEQVRERTFPDRTRSDVILLDLSNRTVVVECKQHAPTLSAIEQLDRYILWLRREMPELESSGAIRGMLVHGGSRRVPLELVRAARKNRVELVHHELRVIFSSSG